MNPLDDIRNLIAIPSVTGSEGDLARHLEKRFRDLGCRTELYEITGGRFNVYAEIPGRNRAKPGVLFHGHMDTVPPHGMESPFIPEVREGQVYGRGSVDQKGGIAAVIAAFEEYLKKGKEPGKSAAFVGVIDEESEHRGSMALKDLGIDAEFGVVTEPTGLKLGIGCKGTAPIRILVKGRAAHGCRPWLGSNAVLAGMDLVREIMDMELPEVALEGLGKDRGSINLGKMDGGRAYNIVADRCSIWFDRRLVPGETQTGVLKDIRKLIDSCILPPGISADAEIARPDWNWEPIMERGLLPALTDMSSPTLETIIQASKSVTGSEPELFFTAGYNEMDFLINDLGMNAVQYGPGDSSLCHTDNEHLDIDQLNTCCEVYLNIIELLCD